MAGCRKTAKKVKCGTEQIQAAVSTAGCDPVSVCLGLGRTLEWTGNCYTVSGAPAVADGWYGQVQVVNGCIVDAKEAELSVYTPAPCAPATSDCSDSSTSSGSSDITLNPESCNILNYVNGMLDATLYFASSSDITVTGCGNANSPLKISLSTTASQTGTIYMQSGSPSVITVTGDGSASSPFSVSMAQTSLSAGTYGAFTIDNYGRITDYNGSGGGTLDGVISGIGVTLTLNNGILQADLTDVTTADTYTLGGYNVSVNSKGQITDCKQSLTPTAGTYTLGGYDVTVTSLGSISSITPVITSDSYCTYTAVYRGSNNDADNSRSMSFTTETAGPIYIEYLGYIGAKSASDNNLMSLTLPSDYYIDIDGVTVSDVIIGSTGTQYNSLRGTTLNTMAAGSHTVTVHTGSCNVTVYDGFMKVQVVGRGS